MDEFVHGKKDENMKNLTLENMAKACDGEYRGDEQCRNQEVLAITTDSREATQGSLFVPIVGQRVDAHKFIPNVMEQGALCTLSEQDLGQVEYPYIKIESSLQAVKDIAEFYLQQLNIPVVGITGSVGKTSTKEVIAAVLKEKYQTLKTQGNFNNELGLPLTIFRLRDEDEMAVLEMGISEFGEMTRLAKVAKPDTCVITNIGQCHLENLGDREGVLKAKTEIFQYVRENGHIILNGDDDKLITVGKTKGVTPLYFGMKEEFPVYATDVESHGLKGMFCRIHMGQECFDVLVPMPGAHMVYNALAATAVGMTYGLTPAQIKAGIESLEPVSGRFHIIETPYLTIVDDCYNANPMSMKASLEVLQDGLGRRVAILGDMGELGDNECALHEEVGAFAASKNIQSLICVGELCECMAQAAQREGSKLQIHYIKTREELLENLSDYIQEGDTVLVKASHFMKFEEVVEALEKLPHIV